MELSLVIPVWNDPDGLDRLLRQVAEMGIFSQILVADDASDEALQPRDLPQNVTLLRSDRQRGAGHARNMALEHIRGSHVIFFDSDDLFAPDFTRIVETAQGEDFDFLIFRHHDSRITDPEGGSFAGEENYWRAVGATKEPGLLTPDQAAILCRLSAYPWNKIYRTGFLRENAIRCTETMVHNDIELHWSSFVEARRILCTSLIGAQHFVAEGGGRLTNRRSRERLEVFRTFENVLERLNAAIGTGALRFYFPFMRFSQDLLRWIEENIDEEHRPLLRSLARNFLCQQIDRDRMTLIAYEDPALARRINRTIIEGRLT